LIVERTIKVRRLRLPGLARQSVRRAAGIPREQKLKMHVSPGRIVIEVPGTSSGKVVKRGKLKVWTGAVPNTPIEEAVSHARHYTR